MRIALLILVLGFALLASAPSIGAAADSPIAALVIPPAGADLRSWEHDARAIGARFLVVHRPDAFIVADDPEVIEYLRGTGARVHEGALPHGELAALSPSGRVGARAWNARLAGAALPHAVPMELPGQNGPDGLRVPGPAGFAKTDAMPTVASAPYGAGFYDTSEFMMGSVAVGVILPESDGSIQLNREDWTTTEIDAVVAGIQGALAYWATRDARADLSFEMVVYDSIATGYEPIRNGTWSSGQQAWWITECMDSLGFTTGTIFERTRAFDNALRDSLGTDWGITMFVIDSSDDPDGRFADGTYAYSYIGGPFLVMTYDNWTWGIGNMDAVAAHEVAHQFYALDEYFGTCTEECGYLGVENQNEINGCALDQLCLMRTEMGPAFDADSICAYTRGHIGWVDSDADSIFDILDTQPETKFDPIPDTTATPTPTITGIANVAPITNQNPRGLGNEITLVHIAGVEWRVDGGPWLPAAAADGLWDEVGEAFQFTTAVLSESPHVVEARAFTSVGNVDASASADTFDVLDVTPPATVSGFAASATDTMVSLRWTNPATADFQTTRIRYRTDAFPADAADGILLGDFPNAPGALDSVVHTGVFPDTTYFYAAFARDEVPNAAAAATVAIAPLEPPPPAFVHAPAAGALYVSTTPAIVWTPAVSADLDTISAYFVQIATTADFSAPVVDSEVVAGVPADTTWTVTNPLAEGTTYFLRIRAKDLSSGTYGYYSAPTSFSTELPVDTVTWRDQTLSLWTNFVSGDTLATSEDALIEVGVSPADILGLGGHTSRVVYSTNAGASWDSLPLAWDHSDADTGFFRGVLELGSHFPRHGVVQFNVVAWDPTTIAAPRVGSGSYEFVAGANPLAALHIPTAAGSGQATMRDPVIGNYLDTLYQFEVAAPAAEIAGAGLRLRGAAGGAFAEYPAALAGEIEGVAFYRASVETLFAADDSLEYYFVAWGPDAFDTTYVAGSDTAFVVTTSLAEAESIPFRMYVGTVTSVADGNDPSTAARLGRNAPNPFNPRTAISFELPGGSPSRARLAVYDVSGRLVRVLADGVLAAGAHVAYWGGDDHSGRAMPSGTYLYVLSTDARRASRRMTLIR